MIHSWLNRSANERTQKLMTDAVATEGAKVTTTPYVDQIGRSVYAAEEVDQIRHVLNTDLKLASDRVTELELENQRLRAQLKDTEEHTARLNERIGKMMHYINDIAQTLHKMRYQL
jgi:hypothetical protein